MTELNTVINQVFLDPFKNDVFSIIFFVLAILLASVWRDFLIMFVHKAREMMLSRDWRTFEAENVNSGPRLQIILFIVYLATIPIFVYHVFNYMSWPLVPIWHLSAILLGLHVLRNVLTKFFEFVFNLKGVYQIWLESYSWIHFTLGVLFFPLAVLVTYSPEVTISFCANLALILFLLSEMLLFYRLCVVFCNSLASLFYLFLYLCTLEIIPLLIVFRILS